MRYYLDTNIIVFLYTNHFDDISSHVGNLIGDCSNTLYTSSVCIMELIHLGQIGKLFHKQKMHQSMLDDVFKWLTEQDIKIVPPNESHLKVMALLPFYEDHRDPCDRIIISQAINDRIALISSDHKFERYERSGLEFIFNER